MCEDAGQGAVAKQIREADRHGKAQKKSKQHCKSQSYQRTEGANMSLRMCLARVDSPKIILWDCGTRREGAVV